MRTVYDSEMVYHLWANQSQDHARNNKDTVSFRGADAYSYRAIIGRIVERKGKRAALLSTHRWSVTTSKHQSYLARAARHLECFHVSRLDYSTTPQDHLNDYRQRVAGLIAQWKRARQNKPYIFGQIQSLIAEANRFAEFFGIRQRIEMPADTESMQEISARVQADNERQRKKQEKERQRKEEERKEQADANLQHWLAGGEKKYPWPCNLDGARLRINGEMIQTSMGAEVPLNHAIKAFKFIKQCHDKGESYERNGHTIHIGHFAIDAIDEYGNLKAGCHQIKYEELERVARQAGIKV